MADLTGFDYNVPDENAPIPAGKYHVEIAGSQVKADEDRVRLSLRCVVLDGEYEGRKLFLDFFLRHPKEAARRIRIQQFKQVCKACGFADVPSDSSELHGSCVTVSITLHQEKYVNLKSVEKYDHAAGMASDDSPF